MILITGGAGFVRSNFVLDWINLTGKPIINLNKLTYTNSLDILAIVQ